MPVRDRISEFIRKELMHGDKGAALSDEESLLDRGILDSLGLLRILAFLEQEYHVTFRDEEIIPEHFESINAIAAFVGKSRNETNRPR